MPSVASERARQELVEAVSNRPVALASRRLEAFAIGDPDRASSLNDETGFLKGARDAADCGALNSEHLGQGFVRQGDVVPIGAITRRQDGAAASGFDAVDGIAGDGLQGLGQKRLGEAKHGVPQFGPHRHAFIEPFQSDARGCSWDLGDVATERLAGHERTDEPKGALPAEDGHLHGTAAVKDRQERDDRVMREICVPDRFSGIEQNLASRQIDDLEMRFEPRKVLWLQSGEEPVLPVNVSPGTIPHGKVSPSCANFQSRGNQAFCRIIITQL